MFPPIIPKGYRPVAPIVLLTQSHSHSSSSSPSYSRSLPHRVCHRNCQRLQPLRCWQQGNGSHLLPPCLPPQHDDEPRWSHHWRGDPMMCCSTQSNSGRVRHVIIKLCFAMTIKLLAVAAARQFLLPFELFHSQALCSLLINLSAEKS